jgi:hypothetical protein
MAYEPKPQKGTLFPNDFKKTETQPDVKGDIFFDRDFLKTLINKNTDGLVKISVSGWKGNWQGKKILNLIAQEPWTGESQSKKDDDLPY